MSKLFVKLVLSEAFFVIQQSNLLVISHEIDLSGTLLLN